MAPSLQQERTRDAQARDEAPGPAERRPGPRVLQRQPEQQQQQRQRQGQRLDYTTTATSTVGVADANTATGTKRVIFSSESVTPAGGTAYAQQGGATAPGGYTVGGAVGDSANASSMDMRDT